MGINKVSAVPQKIATFLGLPEPERYTGHCFRRTACTLTAEAGLTDLPMCNVAGWKNIQTARRYTANTKKLKQNTAALIADIVSLPYTSGTSKINEIIKDNEPAEKRPKKSISDSESDIVFEQAEVAGIISNPNLEHNNLMNLTQVEANEMFQDEFFHGIRQCNPSNTSKNSNNQKQIFNFNNCVVHIKYN